MQKRVVVTGLGALTPLGNSVSEFWQNLVAGTSGAGPITKFDTTHFKTKFACELRGFNAEDYFDRKEARKMDPYCHYALVAADQALADARLLEPGAVDRHEVGVIWGSGNGGIYTFQEEMLGYAEGGKIPRFNPFFVPKMIVDMGSGLISIRHGFTGPNYTTVSACATSNTALLTSFYHIVLGHAKVMVSGGSEAAITEAGIGGFNACKALSTNNEDYLHASRPFDKDRDGFVMGEGAGAIILEELEHAQARGATIYAEIVGGGMSGDAYHMTGTHPEGAGAAQAMRAALREAGILPQDVDHLNLHATSTPLGDMSEVKAVQAVFGAHASRISISATKSMTGHLLGAAGAVEGIAAIMACKTDTAPPTINTINVDPEMPIDFDLTLAMPKKRPIRYALSNCFGFGGHNAIVAFKKWEGV